MDRPPVPLSARETPLVENGQNGDSFALTLAPHNYDAAAAPGSTARCRRIPVIMSAAARSLGRMKWP